MRENYLYMYQIKTTSSTTGQAEMKINYFWIPLSAIFREGHFLYENTYTCLCVCVCV